MTWRIEDAPMALASESNLLILESKLILLSCTRRGDEALQSKDTDTAIKLYKSSHKYPTS